VVAFEGLLNKMFLQVILLSLFYWSQESIISIMTSVWAAQMNCSIPGSGKRFLFSSVSRLVWDPPSFLAFFRGVKRPKHEADHSPLYNIVVNIRSCNFTALYSFTVDAEIVLSLPCFLCEHHIETLDLRRL
jgi:hypothetical protein